MNRPQPPTQSSDKDPSEATATTGKTDVLRDSKKDAQSGKKGLTKLRPLRLLWPYARPYKRQVVYFLIFMVLAASATLAMPIAVRRMIDHGFSPDNIGELDGYFVVLFVVALCLGIFSALRFYWVSWLGERVVADVRIDLYRHVTGLSPAFYEHTRTGEVLSRLNTDTTLIDTVVGSSFSIALRSSAILLGSVVMLIITSPSMAARLALVFPIVLLPIILFGRRIRTLSRQSQDSIADFSALATESLNAIHTVQSFAAEEFERRRFSANVMTAFAKARRRITFRSLMSASVVISMFGGITLMLKFGASSVAAGTTSAGTLSQFVLYAVFAAGSAGGLSEVWSQLQRAAGAIERIAELLNTPSAISSPEKPIELGNSEAADIVFDNVSFAYPSRLEIPALSNFSLRIAPGETVALVGPSGAGKSTVIDLLLRFYDPQNGAITVNGIDVRDTQLQALRSRFGLVAQHAQIFSCSAADNIRYGREDIGDQAIERAAKAALAHEFISQLQDGYQTYLGERGVRLSGGQQQRVAIARAIAREPTALLLDEATSSLDARSESRVQQALDNVTAARTTLVIAHRLATVLKADRIVVMDGGKVVATGTHAELIKRPGIYQDFAKLQLDQSNAS